MGETQKISGCFPLNPTITPQLGHVWTNSLKSSKHSETMQQGMQPAKNQNQNYKQGLQTPDEAFFHRNPTLFGLGRQIWRINFGAFGVFSANLSEPIFVQ
jgi:hypothetical protein